MPNDTNNASPVAPASVSTPTPVMPPAPNAKPAPAKPVKPVKRATGTAPRKLGNGKRKASAPLGSATAKLGKNTGDNKPASKPAKADAATAAKSAVNSAKAELRAVERPAVAKLYGGDSLTFHANAGTKLGAICERIRKPTKAYNETERTGSLAARIAAHVLAKPAAQNDLGFFLSSGADLGVIAMLASGGILAVRDGKPYLASRAKLISCIRASLGDKHVPAGFKA